MKADDKSHLSTSNYANFFECLFFLFQKHEKTIFNSPSLFCPIAHLRYFSCQVKYSYSLKLNVFYCRHFLPISFQFHDFFTFHKLTLFMLTYTTWVCWDRKQSTGLGCLPNASNISTAKNRTVISTGIVFPELVSQ